MFNYTKTIKTEKKTGTYTLPVSQRSVDVSTSASANSISNSTSKETQSKYGEQSKAIKTFKETDNLKRPLPVEEKIVKPKKRKENHSQSFKGKNEASSPKPESDENNSGGSEPSNADSPGDAPKVPPCTIMILATDADTVTRTNGKNGNQSHHTVLPLTVPFEESPSSFNQSNLSNSVLKVTSNTIYVEAQKSTQTRVLRSSYRCGSYSSGATSQGTSSIVPVQKLAQTTLPAAVAGSSNLLPHDTYSEQIENVSAITVFGDNKQATTTNAATSTTTFDSTLAVELSAMQLNPTQEKLKASRIESETSGISSVPNVNFVETNLFSTTRKPTTVINGYQMFLNIRKQIDKRRKNVFPVQPKPPSGFNNYLMNKKTYLLAGNSNSHVVKTQTPSPANLHEQLKKLFVEQEKERQILSVQHIVEKEKLVLSVEQEILRVHGRAARALANQPLPFSVCTILKDEEVYNIMTPEQEEEKDRRSRPRDQDDGRLFLSWLQDVDDKWENIKESMLLRHHNEAESLHAVQKMNWGWKLKELQLCTYSLEPNIDENHVPMVPVSDDFNLLPA